MFNFSVEVLFKAGNSTTLTAVMKDKNKLVKLNENEI